MSHVGDSLHVRDLVAGHRTERVLSLRMMSEPDAKSSRGWVAVAYLMARQ